MVISASAQKVVAEKALTVQAGGYSWYNYNFTNQARLYGKFRAQGGSKNDIQMLIMDTDEFENWKNGNQYRRYYDSGSVTVATFDVSLPKGSYVMVFSNRSAILSPKAVTIYFYE
jgi:hypothetical protein